ncbi:hypothetical protein ACHAXT_008984 [Thalassiosira profunda]
MQTAPVAAPLAPAAPWAAARAPLASPAAFRPVLTSTPAAPLVPAAAPANWYLSQQFAPQQQYAPPATPPTPAKSKGGLFRGRSTKRKEATAEPFVTHTPPVNTGPPPAQPGFLASLLPQPPPPPPPAPEPKKGKLKKFKARMKALRRGDGGKMREKSAPAVNAAWHSPTSTEAESYWNPLDFLCCGPCAPREESSLAHNSVAHNSRVDDANERINSYHAQIEELQRQVAAGEAMERAQREAQVALQEEHADGGGVLTGVEVPNSQLVEPEGVQSNDALAEVIRLKAQIAAAHQQKTVAERERDQIQNDLAATIEDRKESTAKERALQSKIHALSKDVAASVTHAAAVVEAKGAEVERLRARIGELEAAEAEGREKSLKEVQERDARLLKLKDQLSNLGKQKERAEEERLKIEKEFTAKLRAAEDRSASEFALQEKIRTLSKEIGASVAKAETIVRAKDAEVQGMREKIDALEKSAAEGREKTRAAAIRRDERLSDMRAELYRLTSQREDAVRERNQVEGELTAKIERIQSNAATAVAAKDREAAKFHRIAVELKDRIAEEQQKTSAAQAEKERAILSMEEWLGAKAQLLNQIGKDVRAVHSDAAAAVQKKEEEARRMEARAAELQARAADEERGRREALDRQGALDEEVAQLKKKASSERRAAAIAIDVQTDELKKLQAAIEGLRGDISRERGLKEKALRKKSGLKSKFQERIDRLAEELASAEKVYATKVRAMSAEEADSGEPGTSSAAVAPPEESGLAWFANSINAEWLLPEKWIPGLGGDETDNAANEATPTPNDDRDDATLASVDSLVDKLVDKIALSAQAGAFESSHLLRRRAEELQSMERKVQELQSKIDREVEQKQKALADKESVEQKMRKELDAMQTDRSKSEEVKAAMEAQLRDEGREKERLQSEIVQLQAKQKALDEEARRANEGARAELQKIAASLENETNENGLLRSKIATLKRSVSAAVRKKKAVDEQSKKTLVQSQRQNEALSKEIAQMKRNVSVDRRAKQTTIDALHGELDRMREEMRDVRANIERERARKEEAARAKSGLEGTLQKKIDALHRDLSRAESRYAEKLQRVQSLSSAGPSPGAGSVASAKRAKRALQSNSRRRALADEDESIGTRNSAKDDRARSRSWMPSFGRRPTLSDGMDTIEDDLQPETDGTNGSTDDLISQMILRIAKDAEAVEAGADVTVKEMGHELNRMIDCLFSLQRQIDGEVQLRERTLAEKSLVATNLQRETEELQHLVHASRGELQRMEAEAHEAKRRAMEEARANNDVHLKVSKWHEAVKERQAEQQAKEEEVEAQNVELKSMEAKLRSELELKDLLHAQIAELKTKKEELRTQAERVHKEAGEEFRTLGSLLGTKGDGAAMRLVVAQLKAIVSASRAMQGILEQDVQQLIEQSREASNVKGLERLRANGGQEMMLEERQTRDNTQMQEVQPSVSVDESVEVALNPAAKLEPKRKHSLLRIKSVGRHGHGKSKPRGPTSDASKSTRKGKKAGWLRSKKWKPSLDTHDERDNRVVVSVEARESAGEKREFAAEERERPAEDREAAQDAPSTSYTVSLPSYDSSLAGTVDSINAVFQRNIVWADSAELIEGVKSVESEVSELEVEGVASSEVGIDALTMNKAVARALNKPSLLSGNSTMEGESIAESWTRYGRSTQDDDQTASTTTTAELAGWFGF